MPKKVRRKPFSKSVKDELFAQCKTTNTPNRRLDYKGREIDRAAYGQQNSIYGWNVDHINRVPSDNNIKNLRAVHYDTHEELNDRHRG